MKRTRPTLPNYVRFRAAGGYLSRPQVACRGSRNGAIGTTVRTLHHTETAMVYTKINAGFRPVVHLAEVYRGDSLDRRSSFCARTLSQTCAAAFWICVVHAEGNVPRGPYSLSEGWRI